MQKRGEGDGVSQPDADDDDPEVTAIGRRLDSTGDTLGAIEQLQALIIERTGQIPVVTPELLAAAAASGQARTAPEDPRTPEAPETEPARAGAAEAQPDAAEAVGAEPIPAEPIPAEPARTEPAAIETAWTRAAPLEIPPAESTTIEPAHLESADSGSEPSDREDAEADDDDRPETPIDWSIPEPPDLGPEPGFSPWVDPELTAAAQSDEPTSDDTDASTRLPALFSPPPVGATSSAEPAVGTRSATADPSTAELSTTEPSSSTEPATREPSAAPQAADDRAAASQTDASEPTEAHTLMPTLHASELPAPATESIAVPLPFDHVDELDTDAGDDEVVDEVPLRSVPGPRPDEPPSDVVPAPLAASVSPQLAEPAAPRRRRWWWPFGRR